VTQSRSWARPMPCGIRTAMLLFRRHAVYYFQSTIPRSKDPGYTAHKS
jgi:hypothetical protein